MTLCLSRFIISLPGGYMIQRWKAACDAYWHARVESRFLLLALDYPKRRITLCMSRPSHWMDILFTDLFNSVSARNLIL